MKTFVIIFFVLLTSLNIQSATLGEYFTYQGELYENNQPANGHYDLSVNLYETETGGISIGGDLSSNTNVVNGIFSFEIDIGSIPFMGDEVWLELSIKPAGIGSYTDLPRQKITNSPYAIHAQFVGSSGVDSDAIQTGSVTGIKIADNAITQTKLQNSSVGTLQVINASITDEKLADNSVTTSKLTNNSVSTAKIATGAVTNLKMAINSIGSSHIVDGSIINSDIAQNTITSAQLANNTITHFKIDTGAVRSDEILDGTILAADINSSSVQQRISGTCAAGSSIASILANGTVTCENDDVGISGWGLTGNTGTTVGTNFIGTTDNKAFEFKVNNKKALRIVPYIEGIVNESNFIIGSNTIDGLNIKGENSILGGSANTIFSGISNSIVNGNSNLIGGNYSIVIGGQDNHVFESYAAALGGLNNKVGGRYSLAAGKGAYVRDESLTGDTDGDENTFIWSQTGVTSTGPDQVLFEANGGFGIGTNVPAAPMHIKGQGKTFNTLLAEVVMVVEPKITTDDVSIAINKLDSSKESALAFTVNQDPEFDIRTNGGVLDFNSYESGSAKFMMRINNSVVDRIDINTNLEPQFADTYNFGSSAYRWKHIYTEDITTRNTITTDSDRRLKDHIEDLDYGLADILSMRPVSYKLKKGNTEQIHLGFIAQEIKTIVPEIVSQTDDAKHMLSMRYSELIPILIKATQEQQVLIDVQKQQIQELQTKVNALVNKTTIRGHYEK